MELVKVRANPDLKHKPLSFSHGGMAFTPDADGWLDVPEALLPVARTHGFVTADEFGALFVSDSDLVQARANNAKNPKAAAMGKRDLISYCFDHKLDVSAGETIESIRSKVALHMNDVAQAKK